MSASKSGVSATYSLNALGERVRKTIAGVSTYFVYDESGHLVGEYDGSGDLLQETIWFGDTPVGVLKPNGSGVELFYIHTDHLNTPRRISRPSDNVVVWRWDSDPFGTMEAHEDPDGNSNLFVYNPRFPGQYYDKETALHYNYFRDYDPATGRYVQSDPIGLKGGLNTYAYVRSLPSMAIDMFGLYENDKGGPCPPLIYPSHCEFVPDSDLVHEVQTNERRKIVDGEIETSGRFPSWEPSQSPPSPIAIRRGRIPNPGLQIGPTGTPGHEYQFVYRWGHYEVRFDRFLNGSCKCFDECGKVTWFSGARKRLDPVWKFDGKWSE